MSPHSMRQIGVALALTVALLALLTLLAPPITQAQGGEIYVHKALGRSSPVVHVGEYLTFTIFIRNDTTFSVTTLPLSDEFNAGVLGYADALPAPDEVNSPTGHLEWHDLTTAFGDLMPGQGITVVVGFIAEHPQDAVVNRAWVHDAQGASGAVGGGTSALSDTQAVGGSSPVDKAMLGNLAVAGQTVSFTLAITNDGYTTMTVVPLVDHYDPLWFRFSYAVPMPDLTGTGVLTWSDLTLWSGDVSPHARIIVTTVFAALGVTDAAHNRAAVAHAADWYGNELGGGADDVPITIITAPQPPQNTPTPQPTMPLPTPVPATPTPFPTPALTPTATAIPLLPATGEGASSVWFWGLAALLIILGGVLTFSRRAD